jgi:hypothetical protein
MSLRRSHSRAARPDHRQQSYLHNKRRLESHGVDKALRDVSADDYDALILPAAAQRFLAAAAASTSSARLTMNDPSEPASVATTVIA